MITSLLVASLLAGVLGYPSGPGLCDVPHFRELIANTSMANRAIGTTPSWNIITPSYFQSPLGMKVRLTSNPTNQTFLGFLIHTGYVNYQEGFTPGDSFAQTTHLFPLFRGQELILAGQFILDTGDPLLDVTGRPQNAGCQQICQNCFGVWGHTVAGSPLFRTPFELTWYPLLTSATVKFHMAVLVGTLGQPSTQSFYLLQSAEVASGLALPPPSSAPPVTPPNIIVERHSVTVDLVSKVCDAHGYEEVQFQCSGCSNLASSFLFPFQLNRDPDHTFAHGQRLTALSVSEGLIVVNYTLPPRMMVWLNWTLTGRTPRYLRYNITYEGAVMTTSTTLSDSTGLRFSLWGRSLFGPYFAEWTLRLRNVALGPSSTDYRMTWDRPAESGGLQQWSGTGALRPWLELTYPGNDSVVRCVIPNPTDSTGTVPPRVPPNGTNDFYLTLTMYPAWEPWEYCHITTTDKFDVIQGDGDVIAALAVALVLVTAAIVFFTIRCVISVRRS